MSQSQIIFGFHPIISQLRQSSRSIQEIYLDSDRNDPRAKEIVELAKENNITINHLIFSFLLPLVFDSLGYPYQQYKYLRQ